MKKELWSVIYYDEERKKWYSNGELYEDPSIAEISLSLVSAVFPTAMIRKIEISEEV